MTIGAHIKSYRQAKGISVRDLAMSSGISASYLYDIERGRTDPSLHVLRTLAQRLHLKIGDLIAYEQITQEDEWNLLAQYRAKNWLNVYAIILRAMNNKSEDTP